MKILKEKTEYVNNYELIHYADAEIDDENLLQDPEVLVKEVANISSYSPYGYGFCKPKILNVSNNVISVSWNSGSTSD